MIICNSNKIKLRLTNLDVKSHPCQSENPPGFGFCNLMPI